MNVDCHWIEQKLEAFFCDALPAEQTRAAASHLTSCAHCRSRIEELRSVDPLVKRVFHENLAMARVPPRRRSSVTIGAFAASVVSIILLIVWAMPRHSSAPAQPILTAPAQAALAPAETPDVPKVSD